MWQPASQMNSSPGSQCTRTPIWLDIVPEGTNSAASLPSSSAIRSCRACTEGSSSNTSSPTSAAAIAARMPGVGLVTVSLRKSRTRSGMHSLRRWTLKAGLFLVPMAGENGRLAAAAGNDSVILTLGCTRDQMQPVGCAKLAVAANLPRLAAV